MIRPLSNEFKQVKLFQYIHRSHFEIPELRPASFQEIASTSGPIGIEQLGQLNAKEVVITKKHHIEIR